MKQRDSILKDKRFMAFVQIEGDLNQQSKTLKEKIREEPGMVQNVPRQSRREYPYDLRQSNSAVIVAWLTYASVPEMVSAVRDCHKVH